MGDTIEIDIHNQVEDVAKRMLQKTIKECKSTIKYIKVIHGYQNGDTLKRMVQDPKKLTSKRIKRREKDFYNKGVTVLILKD